MSALTSRRGILAALAALPTASAMLGLAKAADPPSAARPMAPHPDQALLDAEQDLNRVKAALRTITRANKDAVVAYEAALGPCPDALRLTQQEELNCRRVMPHSPLYRLRFRATEAFDGWSGEAWTGQGLRGVIALAPSVFGPAGRTPHRIRRWRSLIPLADAFDARDAELSARFECPLHYEALGAAEQAVRLATTQVTMIPAHTLDGLAVKVRHFRGISLGLQSASLLSLIQAAAAACGEKLDDEDPTFDPATWLREVSELGGVVRWRSTEGEYQLDWPTRRVKLDDGSTALLPAHKGVEADRLRASGEINRHKIRDWLWREGSR